MHRTAVIQDRSLPYLSCGILRALVHVAPRAGDAAVHPGIRPTRTHFRAPRVEYRTGHVYTAALDVRGGWVIEEKSGVETCLSIQQVLGGKYIYYFLTTLERGHLQVLPLAFDTRKRTWVETTASIAAIRPE